MNKPKEMHCPSCGQRIGKYDGRSTMNYITSCRKCRKRVIYHVDIGKIEVIPLPQRTCSSGMAFC